MRFDHTKWLIHFIRDRDIEQDYAPASSEEELDFLCGGELEPDASAFSILRHIIKCGMKPYFSFRNGKTTIYGGEPAICMTEMPIYSFIKYVKARNNTKKVAGYGIALLKSDFYNAGGRPVIYGLTPQNNRDLLDVDAPYTRILNHAYLPLSEQYRYVTYNPSPDNWVDWSHEREWRWAPKNNPSAQIYHQTTFNSYDYTPGLSLFLPKNEGGYFSEIVILVWSQEEANIIKKELTGYYLAGSNNYDTPFSREVIEKSKIIVLQTVVDCVEKNSDISAQTIEGLQANAFLEPIIIHDDINVADKEAINIALDLAVLAGFSASNTYKSKHNINIGPCGYADVITNNVTHPSVQYLIKNDLASGPYDGCVHIKINSKPWDFSQSIDYNEYIYQAIVDSLNLSLPDIMFYMRGRLD